MTIRQWLNTVAKQLDCNLEVAEEMLEETVWEVAQANLDDVKTLRKLRGEGR